MVKTKKALANIKSTLRLREKREAERPGHVVNPLKFHTTDSGGLGRKCKRFKKKRPIPRGRKRRRPTKTNQSNQENDDDYQPSEFLETQEQVQLLGNKTVGTESVADIDEYENQNLELQTHYEIPPRFENFSNKINPASADKEEEEKNEKHGDEVEALRSSNSTLLIENSILQDKIIRLQNECLAELEQMKKTMKEEFDTKEKEYISTTEDLQFELNECQTKLQIHVDREDEGQCRMNENVETMAKLYRQIDGLKGDIEELEKELEDHTDAKRSWMENARLNEEAYIKLKQQFKELVNEKTKGIPMCSKDPTVLYARILNAVQAYTLRSIKIKAFEPQILKCKLNFATNCKNFVIGARRQVFLDGGNLGRVDSFNDATMDGGRLMFFAEWFSKRGLPVTIFIKNCHLVGPTRMRNAHLVEAVQYYPRDHLIKLHISLPSKKAKKDPTDKEKSFDDADLLLNAIESYALIMSNDNFDDFVYNNPISVLFYCIRSCIRISTDSKTVFLYEFQSANGAIESDDKRIDINDDCRFHVNNFDNVSYYDCFRNLSSDDDLRMRHELFSNSSSYIL